MRDGYDIPSYPYEVAMFEAGINADTYFYDEFFETNVKKFKAFCEAKKIFFYARPREDFSEWEARQMAVEAGAEFIMMEDMS